MDIRIQRYLEKLGSNIHKKGDNQNKDLDDVFFTLGKLFEIGLIDQEEYKFWLLSIDDKSKKRIGGLNLTARAVNGLSRAGIWNLRQLREAILQGRVLDIRNIGLSTASLIMSESMKHGLVSAEELIKIRKNKEWERLLEGLNVERKTG